MRKEYAKIRLEDTTSVTFKADLFLICQVNLLLLFNKYYLILFN